MAAVRCISLLVVLVVVSSCSTAEAGEGKISGQVFGDYYYVIANNAPLFEDQNGFWFRRIYFTYDNALNDDFSSRFRLEMNSPGDFTGSSKLEPFIKDMYLQYTVGKTQVLLGFSSSPIWGQTVENSWGYRHLEKTPLDLHKMGSSRDFGLAVKGKVAEDKVGYHVMIGNGASTGTETNKYKQVQGALVVYPTPGFLIEAFGDYRGGRFETSVSTVQGFAAYTRDAWRAGILFAHQVRSSPGGDLELDVGSAYVVVKVSGVVSLLVRADRMFDPNPAGFTISYIPFDPSAKSTLLLGGVDFGDVASGVHVIPNLEVVVYDEIEGSPGNTPDTDVIGRVTFYWKF